MVIYPPGRKCDDEETGSPGKHNIYSTSPKLTPKKTSLIHTNKRGEDTTEPEGGECTLKEVTSSRNFER